MPLNAGVLDQRVTLQQAVASQDATGDQIVTWTTLRDVWASVAPIRGRELFSGGATLADTDTRIRIRFAPDLEDINAKWRVLHRGDVYNVYSAAESNMGREFIEIMAKNGINEG